MAASVIRSTAMLRFVTEGDGVWMVVLMAATSVLLGLLLILPFEFTTPGLLQLVAGFSIVMSGLELAAATIQTKTPAGGRQLTALLCAVTAVIVVSVRPQLNLNLFTFCYLLGGVLAFSALLMILDLGADNWWSKGRSMLGVSQLAVGIMLLLHPSYDVLNSLTAIGVLVTGTSFISIVLYGSARPSIARMGAAGAFVVHFPKLKANPARPDARRVDRTGEPASQVPVQRADYDGIALRNAVHPRRRRRSRARRAKPRAKANLTSSAVRRSPEAFGTSAGGTGETGWSRAADQAVPHPHGPL